MTAPTTAWCGCGITIAGTPMQIARAAEIHWRICTQPWQLHDADPRKQATPPIPCCNCGTTTAPLLTRAGRLLCRACWTVGGLLDDDKEVMPHA